MMLLLLFGLLSQDLTITVIDVGQGDATLIEAPGEQIILIDGGPTKFREPSEFADPILEVLAGRTIDLMILTHPHDDHYGGLTGTLTTLDVKEFWWTGETRGPPRDAPNKPKYWKPFFKAMNKENMRIVKVAQGMTWSYKGVSLEVLNAGCEYADRSVGRFVNNDSLVLMLSYAGTKVLFPGDIEDDEGDDLASDYGVRLKADVLKIPHHGSGHFSEDFVTIVSPKTVLISAGDINDHGHPRAEALDAYQLAGAAKFYSTSARGKHHIIVTIRPDSDLIISGRSTFNYWESESPCTTVIRHDKCLKNGGAD